MGQDRLVRTRTIDATPEAVFAVLSDPDRHRYTEPTDWVGAAIDPEPITAVGQVFSIEMFHENAGGRYVMDNVVTAYTPNRTIAWLPGQFDDTGVQRSGGWWWRYDLEPVDGGTAVTLTYDWTDVPEEVRRRLGGFPPVPAEFLDESLAALDAHVTAT